MLGDEVRGVFTDDYRSSINLTSGSENARQSPRVNGITLRWSKDPAELSTHIEIEDQTYTADDVVGPKLDPDQPWSRR